MILSTFSELYIAIIFKRTLKILSIVFINLHHASLDLIYTWEQKKLGHDSISQRYFYKKKCDFNKSDTLAMAFSSHF